MALTEHVEASESPRGLQRTLTQVLPYFTVLYVAYWLGNPALGVPNIPFQILFKDVFKLTAVQSSLLQWVVGIPLYVSFLFGFVRDRWSPFGRRDRGYFMLFGPLAAITYLSLCYGRVGYGRLVVAMLCATFFYRFLCASMQGLTAVVGQEAGMTGRLSTLYNLIFSALFGLSSVLGGWAAARFTGKQIFLSCSILTLVFLLLGLWRDRSVYSGQAANAVLKKRHVDEFARFLRYRAVWPAALIWLLWSFAPGFYTPLLFHLTRTIGVTDTQYGWFMGLFGFSFLPSLVLYGWLCKRVRLVRLLFWGTVVAVPQMIPLLFVRTPEQSLWLAPLLGFMGGVATGAYFDLFLRSCPKSLEGVGIMLADTGYFIALRFGDLFGSWLYDRGGFSLTVWVTTAVYAAILVVLLFVPRTLSDVLEGQSAAEPAFAAVGG